MVVVEVEGKRTRLVATRRWQMWMRVCWRMKRVMMMRTWGRKMCSAVSSSTMTPTVRGLAARRSSGGARAAAPTGVCV